MAETIDEASVISWLDGELDETQAARVASAVATDPALAVLAEAHRTMKARFAAAFGPVAREPVAMPVVRTAPVISLAAVRADRAAKAAATPSRRWAVPGAIAASLVVGVLAGHGLGGAGAGAVGDRAGALALAAPLAHALDTQLSGQPGLVRVALSFRDRQGEYCRGFAGAHLSGVACRAEGSWQLRYAAPVATPAADLPYRMAGEDAARAEVIAAMAAGDPLDAAAERKARAEGWR